MSGHEQSEALRPPTLAEQVEAIRPPAWTIPAEFVSGPIGAWVEVVRLDQLRAALKRAQEERP